MARNGDRRACLSLSCGVRDHLTFREAVMGTRRADGEGSYRQRPNGLWEASTRYTAPDGERKRLSVYGKTRAEARGKLNAACKRLAEEPRRATTNRQSDRG